MGRPSHPRPHPKMSLLPSSNCVTCSGRCQCSLAQLSFSAHNKASSNVLDRFFPESGPLLHAEHASKNSRAHARRVKDQHVSHPTQRPDDRQSHRGRHLGFLRRLPRRPRHFHRCRRSGRGTRRVAEWLATARREARPQRRIAVPVGSAGHLRRTASRQRRLPRRRQRQPTTRRVSKGTWRMLGRGHRQPQRNLCQPQTGRIGGASQRRRNSDGQVPSGVP